MLIEAIQQAFPFYYEQYLLLLNILFFFNTLRKFLQTLL